MERLGLDVWLGLGLELGAGRGGMSAEPGRYVVDADRKLSGIFTQGDFARAYQDDRDVGARPVREFMTGDPVSGSRIRQ